MKTLTIILSTLLLNFCLVAAETPLVSIDGARIQSIAVKAITTKYPDVKSDDLAFGSITYQIVADRSDGLITVEYTLTLTTNKENASTPRTQNIHVALSEKGEIWDVSKGKVFSSHAQ